MNRFAHQVQLFSLALVLCLMLPLALVACDQSTGETTMPGLTSSQTSPTSTTAPTVSSTMAPTTASPMAPTLPSTVQPTILPTATATGTPASTPVPTRAPTPTTAPTSTLNVLQVLNGAFVRLDWGDYQHITVKAHHDNREYEFWVLKDTGISTEDLIQGDQIKVTWRTTMANIPEAGGLIRIDEAVKIEYLVPPPKLNYLNGTFAGLTPGDYLHMSVRELNSTRTRDFWVLRDTGVRPEDLKPGQRIRVTWRNVDLRIPETIEKLNVNEAVRIEYLD